MADAEHELWEVISKWHNYLFDVGLLQPDVKALGKFSEDLDVSVVYAATKPMESDQERISTVKELLSLGLISQQDAIKRLNPDMTPDQVDQKIKEIEDESSARMDALTNKTTDGLNNQDAMDAPQG